MITFLHHLADLFFPPYTETAIAKTLSVERLAGLRAASFHPELQAVSAFKYNSTDVKHLIWTIKYRGNRQAASRATEILYPLTVKLTNFYSADKERWLLVPIPSSTRRRHQRGYDQTLMIAQELLNHDELGMMELCSNILIKIKNTSPQSKLGTKEQRLKNLLGCFWIAEIEKIKDKKIILIDDIITTGSTMREARRTLLAAGAKSVLGASIAWQPLEDR